MAARGRLIALEGIDGCGKSTQAGALAAALGARLTHEPGATPAGARLRELLLSPDAPAVSARTEALLMAADRAEHVAQVLAPALAAGEWVVTDRFSGSTLAYQGWGRGLDVAELTALDEWARDGVQADLTVLVDLPVAVAVRRLGAGRADRLEALGADFATRVREGFVAQAAADPRRWVVVDGSRPVPAVAAQILEVVIERLGAAVAAP